ncbi:DUF2380 domain-containing protein [Methylomarinum vadi]|uniref:DUF2380 domain-containing protein n=1 Tax=Methylomarinum vadi TaxID=438855 RepID=UPI0004DF3095|nr:DUF2380 domain-containing protein [Methylomarinum vadi]
MTQKSSWLLLLLLCFSSLLQAETRIAVLDFELKDLTLMPSTAAERKRTGSLKPLLQQELANAGYAIVDIDPKEQRRADSGFGYLFEHHDVAAQLGERHEADYVVVGRLHKPSFLFAYLMVHLVRVKDGQLIGNFITESKGGEPKLTRKAVESLAADITAMLEKHDRTPR